MNPTDPDPLLNELLADERLDQLRRSSLEASLIELRRAQTQRKRRSQMGWTLVALIFATALAWLSASHDPAEPRAVADPAGPATVLASKNETTTSKPGEQRVRIISDEELFALFPGRAMALIGPPGKQELVFLDRVAQD